MIRTLPLPDDAEVIVIGDTAYDAQVVRAACQEKGYTWIFPANPERVYEGPTGQRPQITFSFKGLDKSVAEDHQASSVHREVR